MRGIRYAVEIVAYTSSRHQPRPHAACQGDVRGPHLDRRAARPAALAWHDQAQNRLALRRRDHRPELCVCARALHKLTTADLAEKADVEILREGMRAAEAIATSGPLASGVGSIIYPQSGKLPSQMTDDEIDAHVRATLEVRLPLSFLSLIPSLDDLPHGLHCADGTRIRRCSC